MITEIDLKLKSDTRIGIRKELTNIFLDEISGTGKGEFATRYICYVEKLEDGRRIYLKRPAALNKGFDFTVHVEDTNFGIKRSTTLPSHKSIVEDLKTKKTENLEDFKKVKTTIKRIFDCEIIDDINYKEFNFKTGHSIELILKVIKWLYIEQDITYWNWSGRNMLNNSLNNI